VLCHESLYSKFKNANKYKLLYKVPNHHTKYLHYMTELCTKYWKCENIIRMASAYNNLVGHGRGTNERN